MYERAKLTDFGLARAADDASLTRTGVIVGTPQFMSPEQAIGDSIDERSDLFSLGSVMYTMCTGRPPFRAETSYGVLRRITDSQPRPIREINPDIPVWLCRVIERLHATIAFSRRSRCLSCLVSVWLTFSSRTFSRCQVRWSAFLDRSMETRRVSEEENCPADDRETRCGTDARQSGASLQADRCITANVG